LPEFTVRRAVPGDAEAVASVFSASFRLLTFLPMLHSVEEDRLFIASVIFARCRVWVAEDAGGIAGVLALEGEEVRLLYVHPDRIGRGAGSALVAAVKQSGVVALELWCFQANTAARRFYERHGFRPIRFTSGSRNEERTPDVRYRWVQAPD
jgi:GNAT superfamily N-acetyltransferase